MNEKSTEYLLDLKGKCGCYCLGDQLYDREGNPMHKLGEECPE